jgi:hypothetical protein
MTEEHDDWDKRLQEMYTDTEFMLWYDAFLVGKESKQ